MADIVVTDQANIGTFYPLGERRVKPAATSIPTGIQKSSRVVALEEELKRAKEETHRVKEEYKKIIENIGKETGADEAYGFAQSVLDNLAPPTYHTQKDKKAQSEEITPIAQEGGTSPQIMTPEKTPQTPIDLFGIDRLLHTLDINRTVADGLRGAFGAPASSA